MLFASRATTQVRPLRRNPEGRGLPGDLLCRAARQWELPLASRRFVHLIPESRRRGHAGLIHRLPKQDPSMKRIVLAIVSRAPMPAPAAFAQEPGPVVG